MNEINLHRVLGLLTDAAGLTQPQDFLHNYMGCMGQVMDYGAHWQCTSCSAILHKRPSGVSQPASYQTNKNPSSTAVNYITTQLGPPNMSSPYAPPMPMAQVMPMINEETIRNALGIEKEVMEKFIEEITRPEPRTPLEHVDQDLRKYTERV